MLEVLEYGTRGLEHQACGPEFLFKTDVKWFWSQLHGSGHEVAESPGFPAQDGVAYFHGMGIPDGSGCTSSLAKTSDAR